MDEVSITHCRFCQLQHHECVCPDIMIQYIEKLERKLEDLEQYTCMCFYDEFQDDEDWDG